MQIDRDTHTIVPLCVYEFRDITVFWCDDSVVCFRMLFRDLLHKKVGTGRPECTAQHQDAGRGKSDTPNCNVPAPCTVFLHSVVTFSGRELS